MVWSSSRISETVSQIVASRVPIPLGLARPGEPRRTGSPRSATRPGPLCFIDGGARVAMLTLFTVYFFLHRRKGFEDIGVQTAEEPPKRGAVAARRQSSVPLRIGTVFYPYGLSGPFLREDGKFPFRCLSQAVSRSPLSPFILASVCGSYY